MRRARTPIAAAFAATMLLVAPPATAAGTDLVPGNGFAPGGKAVNLSIASGQGTPLDPGLYSTTLPVDDTPRYATVSRAAGERLEIGFVSSATWKNGAMTSDSVQGVTIELSTADGKSLCDSSSSSAISTSAIGMVRTAVSQDPAHTQRESSTISEYEKACRTATSYRIKVTRSMSGDDVSPLPTQIAVLRTPKVSGSTPTATSSQMGKMEYEALNASRSVKAGNGFASATPLTPGGYDLTVTPGRRHFFRVHLGWGQRLSVGWQLPKNGSKYLPQQDMRADITLLNPALRGSESVGMDSASLYTSTSGTGEVNDAGVYTAPIMYGNANVSADSDDNADSAVRKNARWQTTPGWYYVCLDVVPSYRDGPLDNTPIPTVVSVRVTGTPQAGPTMALAQPPAGTLSSHEDTSTSPGVWGGALVGGIALVLGCAFIAWRRMRRA